MPQGGGDGTPPPGGGGGGGDDEGGGPTRKSFVSVVRNLDVKMTANIKLLIDQAVYSGFTQKVFMKWLRKTQEYADAYPGNQNDGGGGGSPGPSLAEMEYKANMEAFEAIAVRAGIVFNKSLGAWLIKNKVSPAEFSFKADAVAQLTNNRPLYQQFKKALVQEGYAKPGKMNDAELLKFIAGQGNRKWLEVWNLSRARYAATQAGITLKRGADKYLALNPRLVGRIADKGLSDAALTSGFQSMAEQLLKVLPLSKIQGYGLTKKKIEQAVFGGKNQTQVRQTIEHIMKQEEAFFQPRAAPEAAEGGGFAASDQYRPQA